MDLRSMKFVHDLKMPIQLIYSCVQLLEMEVSPNAKVEGYLQMLLKSADQLQRMVHNVLDEEHPQEEKSDMRVRDVVAEARFLSRQCAISAQDKGIQVHFETNASQFRMFTDGEKLQRILHNLISNALRFTGEGGHVTVSVWVRGDAVEFAVTDDGCGISEEMQERIFDLGVTDGGHGYGLAIVKEYAQALKGSVRVESCLGKGSRFIVRLPVQCMETLGSA